MDIAGTAMDSLDRAAPWVQTELVTMQSPGVTPSGETVWAGAAGQISGLAPSMIGLTVLVLAVFVGYYVVWRVTPALHSPLMAVTNAISSVIIVGALIASGPAQPGFAKVLGLIAVTLASVNIFGGFLVTQRMLSMFKKKQR